MQGRILAARVVAVLADAIQFGLLPLFGGGLVSPINDALDIAVGIAMIALVGWHWAFLPAFIAELVPGVDLVPTWTLAVFFATRRGAQEAPPPSTSPVPPPRREPGVIETKVVERR